MLQYQACESCSPHNRCLGLSWRNGAQAVLPLGTAHLGDATYPSGLAARPKKSWADEPRYDLRADKDHRACPSKKRDAISPTYVPLTPASNPTALTIVQRQAAGALISRKLRCPRWLTQSSPAVLSHTRCPTSSNTRLAEPPKQTPA